MISFFKKYRIFLSAVSAGLCLIALVVLINGDGADYVIFFGLPAVMLGVGTYLANSKGKDAPNASSEADELIKWNKLKESGAISHDEFDKKKKEILG